MPPLSSCVYFGVHSAEKKKAVQKQGHLCLLCFRHTVSKRKELLYIFPFLSMKKPSPKAEVSSFSSFSLFFLPFLISYCNEQGAWLGVYFLDVEIPQSPQSVCSWLSLHTLLAIHSVTCTVYHTLHAIPSVTCTVPFRSKFTFQTILPHLKCCVFHCSAVLHATTGGLETLNNYTQTVTFVYHSTVFFSFFGGGGIVLLS